MMHKPLTDGRTLKRIDTQLTTCTQSSLEGCNVMQYRLRLSRGLFISGLKAKKKTIYGLLSDKAYLVSFLRTILI